MKSRFIICVFMVLSFSYHRIHKEQAKNSEAFLEMVWFFHKLHFYFTIFWRL